MSNYIRRFFKFLITIVVVFVFVLKILPLLLGQLPEVSFREIFTEPKSRVFLIFLTCYLFIFPVINFVNIKRHLNGTFNDNKEAFERTFESLGYQKESESETQIVYRKKSKMVRFIQWYEDAIEVSIEENPVTISGQRKSVARLNRFLDRYLLNDKN